MGINITNSEPTISVNQIIAQYNKDHKTNLKPLTIEEMLGQTVNNIETLIEDFQENGSEPFLKKYYNRWLHRFVCFFHRFVNLGFIHIIVLTSAQVVYYPSIVACMPCCTVNPL